MSIPRLTWLNSGNNTSRHQYEVIKRLPNEFPGEGLAVLEIGSAYGGGVEMMAKELPPTAKVYGFDTFEGHPKDLSDDPKGKEASCMDSWYEDGMLGREGLSFDYQRKLLDEEGLTNAILVKGRVDEHSFDQIDKIHFAILDMDLIKPTRIAYEAIKNKIIKGGYLFFHDALPSDHLPMIHNLVYDKVIPSGLWETIIEDDPGSLVGLKRK